MPGPTAADPEAGRWLTRPPLNARRALVALRSGSGGLLLLALVVGAGSAAFAVLFRWLIKVFTLLLSGHPDYAAVAGAAHPHLPGLGRWFVLFTPVVAGLVYGPLVHFFAREARGHGVPEVMYAVARRGGRIAPQVAAVKALASALCIGGGGSVGREGPIVQIGSALGSTLGRVIRVPEHRLRVLVACGAAGGIAATFNAPLAGVFFAMELILSDFAAEAFGMVVIASVTSDAIGRAVLGDQPFLTLPTFTLAHPQLYLLFALLGLLAGAVGVGFTRGLYAIEDLCDSLWRGPEWLRPAVGGLALGGVLLLLPEMYGVGYPVLSNAILDKYAVGFLILLLVGKIVATSLTIGIGGSGGVFAPSLFIGAMLGSAFGEIVHQADPGLAGPIGAYGLIGMGAVFAGAARAPITAVVIMFELTGQYSIILPLMTAIVLASGISHRLTPDTIYTLKLRRRGVDLGTRETIAARRTSVGQVMAAVPPSLPAETTLSVAAQALRESQYGVLPVVDADGTYLGVLTVRAVSDALAEGPNEAETTTTVRSLVEIPSTLREDEHVDDGIRALDLSGSGAIPVLSASDDRVVGWFDYRAALTSFR
ncbi:MAG TPA: chloride channel protein [Marmoricola sp.]|nr:chloride channel protein [Marmoricola sp.]